MHDDFIKPDWPAPANVRALISTRKGGVSSGPFASLNLGDHVADSPESVAENRSIFAGEAGLESTDILWMKQVHGVRVADLDQSSVRGEHPLTADAATTTLSSKGCVVMTADCMPVLLCDRTGSRVAAVHAGWRGMEQGVIQRALQYFDVPSEVIAYMGPTISQKNFEVGAEVKAAFEARDSEYASAFRLKSPKGGVEGEGEDGYENDYVNKYLGDLYAIAKMLLKKEGVAEVYGGDFCTYDESDRFHSFRRDGASSGRMASLIHLA